MKISVCICTYRRQERLEALLGDLVVQERLPDELVIIDNDRTGSARPVVQRRLAAGCPFPIVYDVQPERGIALTRNMTVHRASGTWLAFIDDDERAPAAWLRQLISAVSQSDADGVLGPVMPVVPEEAPNWIRRGRFYDFPRMSSGAVVPLNRMRFGNVLLRGEPLRAEPGPFDPNYRLMTGEDGDLLTRLALKGAKIVWCDEAIVTEPVESSRLSLSWILKRAMSGGLDFGRKTLQGRYGPMNTGRRALFLVRVVAQMVVAATLSVLTLPMGRHRAAAWLSRAAANAGKLTAFWGFEYHAYAKV